jgi:hypothetical protein
MTSAIRPTSAIRADAATPARAPFTTMHDRIARLEGHAATTADCLMEIELWMGDIDRGQEQLVHVLHELQMQQLVRDVMLFVVLAAGAAFVGYFVFDAGSGLDRRGRSWR